MIVLLLACCLSAPPEITVDLDTLTFGAIVAFPSADSRASLSLGFAPQPGLARRFQREELLSRLSTAGLRTDDLQLPESVLVRRKSQALDPAAVSEAVRNAFARQFSDGVVTIDTIEVPSTQVGTGRLEMTATLPARVDPSVAVYVRVDVRGPGFVKPVFVRTLVEIQRPQPVLKSAVAAQSAVRPEDVEWVLAPVQVNGGAVISTGALTNLVAKRDLHAGEVLTENLLYAPLLVHRGDSVTVKASTGGVTISATMRARASAHYGETIVVEHISSSGTTSARVIGPGLLEALQGTK